MAGHSTLPLPRPKTSLLVYYAGHGLVAGQRHDLYLGLTDSQWAHPEFNALEYDKLRSIVLDSPSRIKVVILDCCFSGRALSQTMAEPMNGIMEQLSIQGTCVLTSAQRDQVALILPHEEHTAFTGRMIRLLTAGVPGSDMAVSIDELYRHIVVEMRTAGLSAPQIRRTQTAGSVALGYNRADVRHRQRALSQRYAAAVKLAERGLWDSSTNLLLTILAEQLDMLGPGHGDSLRTQQYLAHAEGRNGDPNRAIRLLERVFDDQMAVLHATHGDVLRTRQFIAVNTGESGRRNEAVTLLRALLDVRRDVLGPNDEHYLRTAHILALNLAAVGSPDQAVTLLDDVVTRREKTLGSRHPHTMQACRDRHAIASNSARVD